MTPETACDLSAQAICFAADQVKISFQQAIWEYERPVVVFKPRLSLDGDQYCFLLDDGFVRADQGFRQRPEIKPFQVVLCQIVKRMVEIEAINIDRDPLCRHAITNPRNEKAALASGLSDGANPTG